MANTRVVLGNGRAAGQFGAGDSFASRLVVVCHPSPGAATFDPDPSVTDRWGVRLFAVERPGYGSSEPLPSDAQHRVVDRAAEVADHVAQAERIADRISGADLQTFGVIGWGTGSLVAAAMAALQPDRVDALALVNPPAPGKAEELAQGALTAPPTPEALHVSDGDSDLPRHPGLWGRLGRMVDDAFTQGRAGVDADRLLMADRDWIDALPSIRARTRIWLGRRDPVIDEDDVRWWGRRIAGAKAVGIRDSGPLAIAAAWRSILEHVAPQHGHEPRQDIDEAPIRLPDVDPVHPDRG